MFLSKATEENVWEEFFELTESETSVYEEEPSDSKYDFGKLEKFASFFIFLLLASSVLLLILYEVREKYKMAFSTAVDNLRSFVGAYYDLKGDISDQQLIYKIENVTGHLMNLNDKNKQLQVEIDRVVGLLENEDWNLFRRSLYFFSKEGKTWMSAKEDCERRESSLVNIKSWEEQAYIDREAKRRSNYFWLGLYKKKGKPNGLEWTDGSEVWELFWDDKHNQPNNEDAKEDCVTVAPVCPIHHCWHDFPCTRVHLYICKMGPKPEWFI